LDLVASHNTAEVIGATVDRLFDFSMATGGVEDTVIRSALLNPQADYSTFSYNDLTKQSIWDDIGKDR
jgi:hypothetical protein